MSQKKYAKNQQSKERRKRVIQRLENQLNQGIKISKGKVDLNNNPQQPLSEKDIERINKEIEVLKQRI